MFWQKLNGNQTHNYIEIDIDTTLK